VTDLSSIQLRHSPGVLSKRIKPDDPALVLLNPQSGEYYTLDAVGIRIWELCDGTRTVSQIAAIIGQEYDAPIEVIERDALDLVKDLVDEQLLVRAP